VTEQLNEFDGEAQPAARLVGPYLHDSLHFIRLSATGTKANVTATNARGTQVVIRFPRAPATYPSTLLVPKADVPASITEVGAIARALYPFFRTAPRRSPGRDDLHAARPAEADRAADARGDEADQGTAHAAVRARTRPRHGQGTRWPRRSSAG
jgi:hypothetical protein